MSYTPYLPQHIAIIMDGNRRWAHQNKLQALQGHEYVADKIVEELVVHCIERGITFVTLWAFSTENWGRESAEVEGLMKLFRKAFTRNAQRLHELGVRLNTIGDLTRFPTDIQESIQHWVELSVENKKITVTFALNYGGRDELLRAVEKFCMLNGRGNDNSRAEKEELFSSVLDTKNIPDADLIIRPGGEKRLSGFMPWQTVYSEIYFTDVLMPNFTAAELDKALADFAVRHRRFGK